MHGPTRLRIVAISPHQDDVALSTTNFLSCLNAAEGVDHLELVSCFTQSVYTPFPDKFQPGSLLDVRRQEDVTYLQRLGVRRTTLSCLGQLDAPLRAEWNHEADVHDPQQYLSIGDAELEVYSQHLAPLLSRACDDGAVFLAPLGLGHKDHIITNHAALQAIGRAALLLYEDAPYVFGLRDSELQGRIAASRARLGIALSPVNIPPSISKSRWVECLSAYESQFTVMQLEQFSQSFEERGGERLWATPSALAVLRAGRHFWLKN